MGPTPKNKKLKTEKKVADFKQKKNTRRIEIKAPQLAIRNFIDITGKRMNTSCVFYFYVVLFENQNISSIYLQKTSTSFCYSAREKHAFIVQLINIKNNLTCLTCGE